MKWTDRAWRGASDTPPPPPPSSHLHPLPSTATYQPGLPTEAVSSSALQRFSSPCGPSELHCSTHLHPSSQHLRLDSILYSQNNTVYHAQRQYVTNNGNKTNLNEISDSRVTQEMDLQRPDTSVILFLKLVLFF